MDAIDPTGLLIIVLMLIYPTISIFATRRDVNCFTHIVLFFASAEIYRERWGYSFKSKRTGRFISKRYIGTYVAILVVITNIVVFLSLLSSTFLF